jgi:F-type H+-transporting ATPase subunit b
MGIGLDLASFIGQLTSFLILLGLLIYFGYKPIRKMLDERSGRIRESMEQAEATKKEYERAQMEVENRISKAREEARLIVAEAGQFRDKLKEEARREARQEAQAIVDRARAGLERERQEIIDDLRREFADTAILAAEKMISESLDKEKHRRLIEEALEESVTFKKTGG